MKKKIALSLVVAMFFSWICCGCDDSQKKVKFGNYKGEEISWIVLDYDDGTNLLLSEKILDVQEFDPDVLSVSRELNWRYCSLRKWLNNDFYAEAFSADEQAKIVMSMVSIEDPDLENQGEIVQDNVFLLSIDEVSQYFSEDDQRIAKPSSYVNDKYKKDADYYRWWLRTKCSSNYFAYVEHDGSVIKNGERADLSIKKHGSYPGRAWCYGVRPVIKVKLDNPVEVPHKKIKISLPG